MLFSEQCEVGDFIDITVCIWDYPDHCFFFFTVTQMRQMLQTSAVIKVLQVLIS